MKNEPYFGDMCATAACKTPLGEGTNHDTKNALSIVIGDVWFSSVSATVEDADR